MVGATDLHQLIGDACICFRGIVEYDGDFDQCESFK
jgi:hypothetical protein